jgi:hypothetical protein
MTELYDTKKPLVQRRKHTGYTSIRTYNFFFVFWATFAFLEPDLNLDTESGSECTKLPGTDI